MCRPWRGEMRWQRVDSGGTKDDIDLIMGSQKSLCLSGRFEPPHQLLSFAGRSLGSFDAVVEPFVRPMISFRRKSPDRLDVTA